MEIKKSCCFDKHTLTSTKEGTDPGSDTGIRGVFGTHGSFAEPAT